MGITSAEPKRAPYRSTAASVGLHVLLALAIPSFAWTVAQSPEIETISFTKVAMVHIATPTPLPVTRPPAAAPVVAPAVHLNPVAKPVAVSPHAVHQTVQRPQVAQQAQSAPVAAPDVRGSADVQHPVVAAQPQPTAEAQPPREVASVAHKPVDGGYMPLGETQDTPVLDPSVRASIVNLGVHTTLTVNVDADGKVTSIAFSPDVDAPIEAKIRTMLAAAQWDPAVCGGGVSCAGRAVIRL